MADFLEERLPIDVRMGASYADEFAVEITTTRGGSESRRLVHPYPVRHFTINYTLDHDDLWTRVIGLYHRAYGMYAGFRVRCLDDYSTNGTCGTPTATDQPMLRISAGLYQLQKQYGAGATPLAIGLPVRTLFKPVAGTVKVAVSGMEHPVTGWALNPGGQIVFTNVKAWNITGITKGAVTTTITAARHDYVTGDTVYVAGVVGMTQINGKRLRVTDAAPGVDFTVALNSSAYSNYTSGGTLSNFPQTGEAVTAGCEFDLPCRFNSRIDVAHISANLREGGRIDLIELVNP